MADRKHKIPLGTHVSFEGDSTIYEIGDHQTILECQPDCAVDHHDDHWPEPHIAVRESRIVFKPLSKLRHMFDDHGIGRVLSERAKQSMFEGE